MTYKTNHFNVNKGIKTHTHFTLLDTDSTLVSSLEMDAPGKTCVSSHPALKHGLKRMYKEMARNKSI